MNFTVTNEPRHEISNNVVYMTSKASDQPAHMYSPDQSLCLSFEYYMTLMLLTEHCLEFLSLKGGCTDSSESTLAKIPHFRNHPSWLKYLFIQI